MVSLGFSTERTIAIELHEVKWKYLGASYKRSYNLLINSLHEVEAISRI
jgi:hypothetical protein